jgi:hypothetical protein
MIWNQFLRLKLLKPQLQYNQNGLILGVLINLAFCGRFWRSIQIVRPYRDISPLTPAREMIALRLGFLRIVLNISRVGLAIYTDGKMESRNYSKILLV